MKNPKIAILLISASLAIPFAGAQPADGSSDDQVYELNPFQAKAESISGYATTSSVGSSRIAVPVTELASSTITINENLIKDTVAQDLRDTFNMVAGVTHGNAGTGNQMSQLPSIRGYNVAEAQRDGLPSLMFTEAGGFDYSLAERIEIVKGPAGVLYGSHAPGGVINITSKIPLPVPATTIEARVGSFGLYKGIVDHSGVGPENKLGYRVVASY